MGCVNDEYLFLPQDLEKVRRDGASQKEVEKAEGKLRKAHDEYRALVEKYNNIREEFEKRMTTSCVVRNSFTLYSKWENDNIQVLSLVSQGCE